MTYIVRQPGKADREFGTGIQAVQYLVDNPGYAKLFREEELLMTKGIPPHASHDPRLFRGLFAAAAEV